MPHLAKQEKQWIILINDTYWHKSWKSQEIYNGMSKKVAISSQVYAKLIQNPLGNWVILIFGGKNRVPAYCILFHPFQGLSM